jgi:hypothetical protein
MTPGQMAVEAVDAAAAGARLTLVRAKGARMPPKFPRGELLCEQHDGTRAYSYDPERVLAWLVANGLVEVQR